MTAGNLWGFYAAISTEVFFFLISVHQSTHIRFQLFGMVYTITCTGFVSFYSQSNSFQLHMMFSNNTFDPENEITKKVFCAEFYTISLINN
jgi:hypothetical protein